MKSIFETLVESGNFKELVGIIQKAGMEDALRTSGPYTLFAPTDQAFDKLPKNLLEPAVDDKEKLARLIQYHMVEDRVTGNDLKRMKSITSALGERLYLDTTTSTEINHVKISEMDIKCTNGMIHGISEVLLAEMNRILA